MNSNAFERHYTAKELADIWHLSDDTVRSWFEDVPGVLKHGNDGSRGARRKVTLRIPQSVAVRVYDEKSR